jgi:hypothetical protein
MPELFNNQEIDKKEQNRNFFSRPAGWYKMSINNSWANLYGYGATCSISSLICLHEYLADFYF